MIKNRLREIRLKLSAKLGQMVTQEEMATMLGISMVQYGKYERQDGQPSLENAIFMAQKLHIPVEEIFLIE